MSDAVATLTEQLHAFDALKTECEAQEEAHKAIRQQVSRLEKTLVPAARKVLDYAQGVRNRADELSDKNAALRAQLVVAQDRANRVLEQLRGAVDELNIPLKALEDHRFRLQGVDPHQALERVQKNLQKLSRKTSEPESVSPLVTTRGMVRPTAFKLHQDVEGVAVIAMGGFFDDEQTVGWLTTWGTLKLEPLNHHIAGRMGVGVDEDGYVQVEK